MKNSAHSGRAQAHVIFVLIIMVLAIAGLAIEGDSTLHPPPVLNPAASTALAAALCRSRGNKDCIQRAYDLAAANGYPNDGVRSQLEVYTCDMAQASCGSYAGNPDYFQVILTTYKETFLTKIVGIQERERVQALALGRAGEMSLVRSSKDSGTGRRWVFSVPPWVQYILQPYRLVLLTLFIVGVLMIGLPPLLRRKRAKPV